MGGSGGKVEGSRIGDQLLASSFDPARESFFPLSFPLKRNRKVETKQRKGREKEGREKEGQTTQPNCW